MIHVKIASITVFMLLAAMLITPRPWLIAAIFSVWYLIFWLHIRAELRKRWRWSPSHLQWLNGNGQYSANPPWRYPTIATGTRYNGMV